MSTHPMDELLAGLDRELGEGQGAKFVARVFGEALERVLDGPDGDAKLIAWLESAAERRAKK